MNKEKFIEYTRKLGIELNENQLKQFEDYYNLLIEWNEKMNLTGITENEQVYLKHFFDSLSIVNIIKLDNQNICDIGSGAGFPGISLKIAFPNLQITLVDSLNKRCNFLNKVIKELNLDKIDVINERAEIFTNNNREKYNIVTARAVAPLNQLLEISSACISVDGYFIAMKTKNSNEIINIDNCLKELNLKVVDKISFILPFENSERLLISFKKIGITNKKYPRKYNLIKNNGL